MTREELERYLAEFCANKACFEQQGAKCDICMYEKGRQDAIEEFYNKVDRLVKLDSKQTYYYTEFCRFMMEVKEQLNRF